MRRPRRTAAWLAALALAAAIAPVEAQPGAPARSDPVLLAPTAKPGGRPALTAPQLERLREAQEHRNSGALDRARRIAAALLQEAPHDRQVVEELARIHAAAEDHQALERLARGERAALRDSVFLGRLLIGALERLERPREAARVAIEMWCASPREADWAEATVVRLLASDARGVRDVMREAAVRRPERIDIVRGLARVQWRSGEPSQAIKTLAEADGAGGPQSLRARFAEELLAVASTRDSNAAEEALTSLASDARRPAGERIMAAHRAWSVASRRARNLTTAQALQKGLTDVPASAWSAELRIAIARALREGGDAQAARALLESGSSGHPGVALERALAQLRDEPSDPTLAALRGLAANQSDAVFPYAEALFFAGRIDSAHVWYDRVAANPAHAQAGAALERLYLIEDAEPKSALPAFGRLAYAEWRGEPKQALALADSLYRSLPRGALWAQAAIRLSAKREAAGDLRLALAPVLAVADSLAGDRLASLARQRAGDLYARLGEEPKAVAQYEECLARYPRAWNAAEVRRKLELLRKERRF